MAADLAPLRGVLSWIESLVRPTLGLSPASGSSEPSASPRRGLARAPAFDRLSDPSARYDDYPPDPLLEPGPIDVPRLRRRLRAYGDAYDIPSDAVRQMDELLCTPLAARLLALPPAALHDMLILDAYKPRMHVMYDKYMDGCTADFALVVRRAPPAADPAVLPHTGPELWSGFQRALAGLADVQPYSPHEVEALRTQFGMELPRSLLAQAHKHGVARVTWQPRGGPEGGEVAIASGPLVSASLAETACMQRFQELAVAAQVAAHRSSLPPPAPGCPPPLDRTERLASALARLGGAVGRINAAGHGCSVALFAGRRASDPLYLVLQNLYCAAHLTGYSGTSSVFVAAVLGREWTDMVPPERETWGGTGRLVGTHAHEQASALQQLLAPYDLEAGRRAGLPPGAALPVTPLLAHLLFLAANGGGGPDGCSATALPDSFTTPAFLAVATAAEVPEGLRRDLEAHQGWAVPQGARCFDLFRRWRVDSGDYAAVAEAIMGAWEGRCAALAARGRPGLPRPLLMHSNLDSVEDIERVARLPERIRPATLAFGTLADGFLPFLPPEQPAAPPAGAQLSAEELMAAAGLAAAAGCAAAADLTAAAERASAPAGPTEAAAAADGSAPRPTVALASVVMKLVQARPPRPLPPLGSADGAAGLPASAVKLGDGAVSGGKAQVDPRLPPAAAAAALAAAVDMAHGAAAAAPLCEAAAAAVSSVLAEAYEAVVRGGVLKATP
ncbi:hypothetical protein HYH03_004464 [Edaphochlamys debaryana]|uniref:Uncharacterized protein n=1 Tax=Edaphochlamys debaryana TaxID=47281 RepID=A0A836C3E3_9CHLO|nr:hypothetical protein HYH03_004464 [Edaphochlamys debaryana]|eukprot:KAG2497728.1 hypothetical protein HYH03_004464 [Edaphochlamys debaryana]